MDITLKESFPSFAPAAYTRIGWINRPLTGKFPIDSAFPLG